MLEQWNGPVSPCLTWKQVIGLVMWVHVWETWHLCFELMLAQLLRSSLSAPIWATLQLLLLAQLLHRPSCSTPWEANPALSCVFSPLWSCWAKSWKNKDGSVCCSGEVLETARADWEDGLFPECQVNVVPPSVSGDGQGNPAEEHCYYISIKAAMVIYLLRQLWMWPWKVNSWKNWTQ